MSVEKKDCVQEDLLHYIWKNALLGQSEYLSDTGDTVRIIHHGIHNPDAGPDFTNARIRIGSTVWAGNVEIHRQSCDWYHHRHHLDASYNNVILHVVMKDGRECYTNSGRRIPVICIEPDTRLENKYCELMLSEKQIPCARELPKVDHSLTSFWLDRLLIERLSGKTEKLKLLLKNTLDDWEETFYIQLSRNFGMNVNALPFELLARSLPLKIIRRDPGNLFRTEALFFGQAGFLKDEPDDTYARDLRSEYVYCRKKYRLTPLEKPIWKFLRLRPSNFPTIRIAQLSALLNSANSLFPRILEFSKPSDVVDFFSCEVSEYWKNHYIFDKASAPLSKKLGTGSIYLMIINTVSPFLFVYGTAKNEEKIRERAIDWLEQIPAEKNHLIRTWEKAGIVPRHAADSQALIQLTMNYCRPKKCLNCQIGSMVLKP